MAYQIYQPTDFTDAYRAYDGARLWRWLNHPRQIEVMDTATYLQRPAVEALSPHLQLAHGTLVGSRHCRRMIDDMVSQIMRSRGCEVAETRVRIVTPDNLFGWGATFRLPMGSEKKRCSTERSA